MHPHFSTHIDYDKGRYVITKETYLKPVVLTDEEKKFLDDIELDEQREFARTQIMFNKKRFIPRFDREDIAYFDLATGNVVFEVSPSEVENDADFKEKLKSLQDNIIVFKKENGPEEFIKRMTELFEDSNTNSVILDVFQIENGRAHRFSTPGFSKNEKKEKFLEDLNKKVQWFIKDNVDAVKICVNGDLY